MAVLRGGERWDGAATRNWKEADAVFEHVGQAVVAKLLGCSGGAGRPWASKEVEAHCRIGREAVAAPRVSGL